MQERAEKRLRRSEKQIAENDNALAGCLLMRQRHCRLPAEVLSQSPASRTSTHILIEVPIKNVQPFESIAEQSRVASAFERAVLGRMSESTKR
jgi:hypothetical protein